MPDPATHGERLQKVLARTGMGSRREIESWIRAGRLSINQRAAQLGDRISDTDRVALDGKPLNLAAAFATQGRAVLLYHKPAGEVTSRKDPEGRATVFDRLPKPKSGRWIVVGRLDLNTSGLLMFTTDGELAKRLMHPSSDIEREYAVRVHGEVDEAMVRRLVDGVQLEDGPARFDVVEFSGGEGRNMWFHVIIKEGRTREVRRLWDSQGVKVSRLTRVRFGPIVLPRALRTGQWRMASDTELAQLEQLVGLESQSSASSSNKPTTTKQRAAKQQGKDARPQVKRQPVISTKQSVKKKRTTSKRDSATNARQPIKKKAVASKQQKASNKQQKATSNRQSVKKKAAATKQQSARKSKT